MLQDALEAMDLHCDYHPWRGVLSPRVRDVWVALMTSCPETPVFNHPEWLEAAVTAGALRPSGVLLVSTGAGPIALLVLERYAPWAWRIASIFGMDTAILIILPEAEEMAWQGIARWLRRQRGIGRLEIGPCLAPARLTALLLALRGQRLYIRLGKTDPSYQITLADSWPAYLRQLGKSTREKLQRIATYLQREGTGTVLEAIDDPDAVANAFDAVVRLYRHQWGAQAGGSLLCAPANVRFYHAAMRWAVARGMGSVLLLRHDGRTLAAGTVFHIPGQPTAYFQFLARDTGVGNLPHALGSPGIVLTVAAIRWAQARQAAVLSKGTGKGDYKQLLGADPRDLRHPIAARTRLAGVLIHTLARSLHLCARFPTHLRHRLRG